MYVIFMYVCMYVCSISEDADKCSHLRGDKFTECLSQGIMEEVCMYVCIDVCTVCTVYTHVCMICVYRTFEINGFSYRIYTSKCIY